MQRGNVKKGLGKGDDATKRHADRQHAVHREKRALLIDAIRHKNTPSDTSKFAHALALYRAGQGDPVQLLYEMSCSGTDDEIETLLDNVNITALCNAKTTIAHDCLCNFLHARTIHRHALVDTLIKCKAITTLEMAANAAIVGSSACNDIMAHTDLISSGALIQGLQDGDKHAYVFTCAVYELSTSPPPPWFIAATMPHLIRNAFDPDKGLYAMGAIAGLSHHIPLPISLDFVGALCRQLPTLTTAFGHQKRALHIVVAMVGTQGNNNLDESVRNALMPHLAEWLRIDVLFFECCSFIEILCLRHQHHVRAFAPLFPILVQCEAVTCIVIACTASINAQDTQMVQTFMQQYNAVGACCFLLEKTQDIQVLERSLVLLYRLHLIAPGEVRSKISNKTRIMELGGHNYARVADAADRLITALQH